MRTISESDLYQNLDVTLERVTEDHEPVVVTRERGKPSVVLISLEDFASCDETAYLLKSPQNTERLQKAIGALDVGDKNKRPLAE